MEVEGRARTMRMLSDSPTADDASTAPLLVTPASATTGGALLQPAGGGSSTSVYPDSNIVIILAALLCVLICALGINSLVRCARHCGRSLATGAAPATTADAIVVVAAPAAAAVVGLSKRELGKIPVVEYETNKAGGIPGTECAICLGEFADGEKVRLLPRCHHGFHVRCIDRWLAAHSSCPICRNSLLEEGHGAGDATVAGEAM